jgi:transcription initiation factor IIF auxiliary subunit
VVTVERPPFEISNKGWGEAPVAIELYLHDVFVHRGENPVYLIHNLTVLKFPLSFYRLCRILNKSSRL